MSADNRALQAFATKAADGAAVDWAGAQAAADPTTQKTLAELQLIGEAIARRVAAESSDAVLPKTAAAGWSRAVVWLAAAKVGTALAAAPFVWRAAAGDLIPIEAHVVNLAVFAARRWCC